MTKSIITQSRTLDEYVKRRGGGESARPPTSKTLRILRNEFSLQGNYNKINNTHQFKSFINHLFCVLNGPQFFDVDGENLTVTDTELRIAFAALDQLFRTYGKDDAVNVNITTLGGTATVTCKLVDDPIAG